MSAWTSAAQPWLVAGPKAVAIAVGVFWNYVLYRAVVFATPSDAQQAFWRSVREPYVRVYRFFVRTFIVRPGVAWYWSVPTLALAAAATYVVGDIVLNPSGALPRYPQAPAIVAARTAYGVVVGTQAVDVFGSNLLEDALEPHFPAVSWRVYGNEPLPSFGKW
jgi:hypothetical protein